MMASSATAGHPARPSWPDSGDSVHLRALGQLGILTVLEMTPPKP